MSSQLQASPRRSRLVSVLSSHFLIAANVYCSWFFGQQGYLNILPAYLEDLISPKAEGRAEGTGDGSFVFVREMSGIDCVQKTSRRQPCNKKENFCNVDILMSSVVRHGKWVCHGVRCNLYCEVRENIPTILCHSSLPGWLPQQRLGICLQWAEQAAEAAMSACPADRQ